MKGFKIYMYIYEYYIALSNIAPQVILGRKKYFEDTT